MTRTCTPTPDALSRQPEAYGRGGWGECPESFSPHAPRDPHGWSLHASSSQVRRSCVCGGLDYDAAAECQYHWICSDVPSASSARTAAPSCDRHGWPLPSGLLALPPLL